MRVLLVCHGYPPAGVAGVERLSAQTAGELTARGHEVTVLTRRPSAAPPTLALERERRAGVPVVSISGAGATYEQFPGQESSLERIFERMLVETNPDIVLATHLIHHSPGYVEVAHRWGVPVVLELHDFFAACPRAHLQRRSGELCDGPDGGRACATHCFADQRDAELRWAMRAQSFREAVREADAVLCPSRFVAEAFAPLRASGRPIEIVANAVTNFGPVLRSASDEQGPLRLSSIGVTVEHKGFHVVVEALRRATLPAARYTVLGRVVAPQSRSLYEQADRVPGLELRLFGGFEPAHLPALLADADAVVVPSLVPETFSIVAREAFACGVPVIASRIGALPDAIREGENGWLFEPGDASALASLLQRLDADREQIRHAAKGIRPDDVVSVAQRTDQVEALLRGVVHAGHEHRDDGVELRLMRSALAAADDVHQHARH